jgi:hypothetical protein
MTTTINTKPNTFYIRKDLDDDTGVTPCYPDIYEGLGATFNINSNPKTTYLIGESTVVTANDYEGEGTINEMYISAYANTITQVNPQTAPYMDVYNVNPNVDITEGDMTVISGTSGLLSTFTSYYDMGTPWLAENFDGEEKHFFNVDSATAPRPTIKGATLIDMQISVTKLVALIKLRQKQTVDGVEWT